MSAPRWRGAARACELAAACVAPAVFLALNRSNLRFYFMRDDPCLLASVAEEGIPAHLGSPEVWRALSPSLLMPVQLLSLGLDLRLFGADPRGFYAHHLAAFVTLLVLGFALLRRFSRPLLSAMSLVLFATAPPAIYAAGLLMNRHYVEGLALSIASLLLQWRALERSRPAPAVASAVCYGLAACAKEVFVPLPLLMPLLPGGARRARLLLPHALLGSAYAAYRVWMLGWSNSFQSYGTQAASPHGPATGWALSLGAVGALAALLLVRRSPRNAVPLAVLAVALATPLAFLSTALEPRHYFVPSFAVAALAAGVLALAPWRRVAEIVAVATAALSVLAAFDSGHREALRASEAHYRAEGSFVAGHPAAALLLTTLPNSLYLSCTQRLARALSGRRPRVAFCGTPCACPSRFPGQPTWIAPPGEPVRPAPEAAAEDACSRDEVEVRLDWDRDRRRLSWSFGPWDEGQYAVALVFEDGPGGISPPQPLPRQGSMPFSLARELRLLVQHRSPEGRISISDVRSLAP